MIDYVHPLSARLSVFWAVYVDLGHLRLKFRGHIIDRGDDVSRIYLFTEKLQPHAYL